jgi:hypothetical protein
VDQFETYLRLALRAQTQCRATLETLAAIKNPQPVAFVRQANIAHGPQQVNNAGTAEGSRAGDTKNQQNKVLDYQHGERLDTATAGAAISCSSGTGDRGRNRPDQRRREVRRASGGTPSRADTDR